LFQKQNTVSLKVCPLGRYGLYVESILSHCLVVSSVFLALVVTPLYSFVISGLSAGFYTSAAANGGEDSGLPRKIQRWAAIHHTDFRKKNQRTTTFAW
jgi:hypothetical protein